MAMEVMSSASPSTMFRRATHSAASNSTIVIPKRNRYHSLSTITEDNNMGPGGQDSFDLPPITPMKGAISRRKISEGVSYALPIDKSRNAVEGQYRTNLRLMFKEPYVSEASFDAEWLAESCRHHLQPNTLVSLMSDRSSMSAGECRLNMDSEEVRKRYAQSAPSGGLTGRMVGPDALRPRSTLFLPLKAKIPPEVIKLKEEADRILQAVQKGEDNTSNEHDGEIKPHASATTTKLKKLSRHFSIFPDLKLHSEASEWSDFSKDKKASSFGTYEALKAYQPPKKRPLPEELMSEKLGMEKCERIWDWLWNYEVVDELSYFMEIVD